MTDDSREQTGTERRRRSRRAARTDWRLGGHTVRPWRESLLAVACGALAVTIVIAALVDWLVPEVPLVGVLLPWAAMTAVVVFALSRSRPVGLLRLRAVDVLFGLGFGLVLRTVSGWMESATTGGVRFPSFVLVDGRIAVQTWAVDVVGAAVVAPVLEELFFRGVVLVCVYGMLRRPFGRRIAGVAAVLVSTGIFVLVHAVTSSADPGGAWMLALLGLVCASLVMLTGRIWSAVFTHVCVNASYVVLALIGTFWG